VIIVVQIIPRGAEDRDPSAQLGVEDMPGLLERLGFTKDVWTYLVGQTDDARIAEAVGGLVRSLPIFFRVAFMPIRGPVRVRGSDVRQLLHECKESEIVAGGAAEAELLRAIGALGERALDTGAELMFGFANWGTRAPGLPLTLLARSEPDGVVKLLTPEAPHGSNATQVELWDLSKFYERLGVTAEDFRRWDDAHGWGRGVLEDGASVAAGFPMFSQVAWMWGTITPLQGDEIPRLIEECGRADRLAAGTPEADIVRQIRELAERAVAEGGSLEFGYQ
jgi:hypothetical protein